MTLVKYTEGRLPHQVGLLGWHAGHAVGGLSAGYSCSLPVFTTRSFHLMISRLAVYVGSLMHSAQRLTQLSIAYLLPTLGTVRLSELQPELESHRAQLAQLVDVRLPQVKEQLRAIQVRQPSPAAVAVTAVHKGVKLPCTICMPCHGVQLCSCSTWTIRVHSSTAVAARGCIRRRVNIEGKMLAVPTSRTNS